MGEAVALSERLEQTQELSQALGLQTLVKFVAGQGLDESNLRRAVQLEDRRPQMLVALRPTLQNALLLACTGRLEEARLTMLSTRRECRERGDEAEAMFAAAYSVLIEIWRGNYDDAAVLAEETMELASLVGAGAAKWVIDLVGGDDRHCRIS